MSGREGHADQGPPAASATLRYGVLAIVTLVVTVNYLDRYVLSILIEPIRHDLRLTDSQIGLLTGAGFALLYSTLALPIARLAERRNRVGILTIAVALWSLATAFCGLAGSFLLLFLGRVMVGCGEAGAIAPSQSMVADLFPFERRGTAMAVIGMGSAVGGALAPWLGGHLEAAYGWRSTFVAFGAAGVPLVALLLMFVRDPARGLSDGVSEAPRPLPLGRTLSRLFRRRAFALLIPALILMALGEYSMILWMPAFFQRSFGIAPAVLGGQIALYQGVPFFVGTYAGGALADRLSRRDRRWIVWVPMIGAAMTAPAVIGLFAVKAAALAFPLLMLPSLVNGLYVGPCYALIQNLAAAHSRATATAVLVFSVNLVGAGLGPFLLGGLSDLLHDHFGDQSLRYAFFSLAPIYLAAAAVFAWVAAHIREDLDDARRDTLGALDGPAAEASLV